MRRTYRKLSERPCEGCREPFAPTTKHRGQRFCSQTCRIAWLNSLPKDHLRRPRKEVVTYQALHAWVNSNFGRTGRCELCGQERYTNFASKGHTYTRKRADWIEVCVPCHREIDGVQRDSSGRYVKRAA